VLTCAQWVVGSDGGVEVEYDKGGVPVILVLADVLQGSGLCVEETAAVSPITQASGDFVPRVPWMRELGLLVCVSITFGLRLFF
jgi:hypothetical protein